MTNSTDRTAPRITVCVLLYGDHLLLAMRCLNSLTSALDDKCAAVVSDFRLGLNEVAPATGDFARTWSHKVANMYRKPVHLYIPECNVGKYPLMRRMIHDPARPPADYVMWFDDDSYLTAGADWWSRVIAAMGNADIVGQCDWYFPLQGRQWEWIARQGWFNPDVGLPPKQRGRSVIRFTQGAWWTVRSSILKRFDWPPLELRHNGGDSMLGELFRHQGLRMKHFSAGVRINADEAGRHSRAPRRGLSEPPLGSTFEPGTTPDLSLQNFECSVESQLPIEQNHGY